MRRWGFGMVSPTPDSSPTARDALSSNETAIIVLGHLGSGLTPNGVGSDAFDLICRPDPGMAHSRLKALASSDLIGAWFQAPSQSCPLAWPARHPSGGKYERSRRPTR